MEGFQHPYEINPAFQTRVAYFCMEFGIDQALKTFSGGLGYLAGSHMRSAFDLGQNLVGISILWKFGYYDQHRHQDQSMEVLFMERFYNFLQDTGIQLDISVDRHPVKVKVWYLDPHVFNTAPIFFLSTDIPENDHLARTICHRLYDSQTSAKIAQYILLGQGGMKLLNTIGFHPEKIHLNEAHALPAAFYIYYQDKNLEALRHKLVFTTHTPVPAGNEQHDIQFLKKMGFFHDSPLEEIRQITKVEGNSFNLTLGALRLAGKANAVSEIHGHVARDMWDGFEDICHIDHITNSQHAGYWTDQAMLQKLEAEDNEGLRHRKMEMKRELFKEVADQTGKIFDEKVLTIVWARRFAPYKRADLITWQEETFERLMKDDRYPLQIIWAGKPYPLDYGAINVFNTLVQLSKKHPRCAVLVGYELELSKKLKQGSDVWLNTPRITREASGTSGMTAAMNGSINFSTNDGWIPEFAKHLENAFIIPPANLDQPMEGQDLEDLINLYDILQNNILPMYYDHPQQWTQMVKNSMRDVVPAFDSNRMATEYYQKLYS